MSTLREIIEWLICIIIAVVLALVVKYYIGTPTIVQQTSMYPTLKPNERLWLNRWGRTIKKMPERGDIITFEAPRIIRPDEIDKDNPIAVYNYEPEGLIEKFMYYVIEDDSLKRSYIKRVIALPGEHLEIKNGSVYIDGKKLQEEYLTEGMVTDMMQVDSEEPLDIVIPENCVFAMGDNRTGSTDCRAFGCIPLEKIEGTVSIRFWPFSEFGGVE